MFYIFIFFQGVPNPAVLPVRHRLRQRDRPDPPSVPSLLAKHLLQGDAGSLCHGGRLLRWARTLFAKVSGIISDIIECEWAHTLVTTKGRISHNRRSENPLQADTGVLDCWSNPGMHSKQHGHDTKEQIHLPNYKILIPKLKTTSRNAQPTARSWDRGAAARKGRGSRPDRSTFPLDVSSCSHTSCVKEKLDSGYCDKKLPAWRLSFWV